MLWCVWHACVSIYFGKISGNKSEIKLKFVIIVRIKSIPSAIDPEILAH